MIPVVTSLLFKKLLSLLLCHLFHMFQSNYFKTVALNYTHVTINSLKEKNVSFVIPNKNSMW